MLNSVRSAGSSQQQAVAVRPNCAGGEAGSCSSHRKKPMESSSLRRAEQSVEVCARAGQAHRGP